MTFIAVTSHTWTVTLLGFGIVVLLLFCFVYIMKLLGWIMQPKGTIASKQETAVKVTPAQDIAEKDDMAAVALAMHLYYNSLHDIEAPRLTIKTKASKWKTV